MAKFWKIIWPSGHTALRGIKLLKKCICWKNNFATSRPRRRRLLQPFLFNVLSSTSLSLSLSTSLSLSLSMSLSLSTSLFFESFFERCKFVNHQKSIFCDDNNTIAIFLRSQLKNSKCLPNSRWRQNARRNFWKFPKIWFLHNWGELLSWKKVVQDWGISTSSKRHW